MTVPLLTITVSGLDASGQSTVAQTIARALTEAGLEVKLTDDEVLWPLTMLFEHQTKLAMAGLLLAVHTQTLKANEALSAPDRVLDV